MGFAKVDTDKTPFPAADIVSNRVLPFFDDQGMRVLRVLTDNGTEYCGVNETHPYELYLHLNDIEHSRTEGKS